MKHIENSEIKRTLVYIVLITLTVFSLFPFFVLIVNATRTHAQIMKGFSPLPGLAFFSNLGHLLSNPNIPVLRALGNSILVSVMSTVLTTYFSAMTAYGIFMYNFKGKQFAFKLILALMMIPTQVSTLGFIRLLIKIKMIDTLAALYIPAIASPVVFFYMYQSMEATLPYSIVEAARVDGSNEFYTFNAIVCPMLKPAFAVQSIFAFVSSWNNYFVPALVISDKKLWTVPIVIANARSADYMMFDLGVNYTLMTVAILPLIVIYFLLSRYIIGGVTAGGVKE